jgi:hypothetical protein
MAANSLAFTPSPIQEASASTVPRNKSHKPAPTGALIPLIGAPVSRFIVRFADKHLTVFLRDYNEALSYTDDIQEAKLFTYFSSASLLADLFHAEPIRVVVGTDGKVRSAIQAPRIPLEIRTEKAVVSASPVAAEALSTTAGTPLSPLASAKHYDSPAKKLFVDFLEQYLGIEFQGFQAGFASSKGATPDLILFRGSRGSTLAVPVAVMLEGNRETALEIIRAKKSAAEKSFRVSALEEDAGASDAAIAWG